MNNLYEILGVNRNSTLREIKNAYRNRARIIHPDSNPNLSETECHKKMCELNNAYKILSNMDLRAEYDEMIDNLKLRKNNKKSYSRDYSIYKYYNSVDYDINEKEAFIEWILDFSLKYVKYYYRANGEKRNSELLDTIYENFENIIFNERESFINISKKLSL